MSKLLRWCALLSLGVFFAGCGGQTVREVDPQGDIYGMYNYVTNIERFAVYKRNDARDICVVVNFAIYGSSLPEGPELPDGWVVESAWRAVASQCDALRFDGDERSEATSVTGRVVSHDGECDVDVDLTLGFPDGTSESLLATGLGQESPMCE